MESQAKQINLNEKSIQMAEESLKAAKEAAMKARQEFIDLLPEATDDQLESCIVAVRLDGDMPEGYETKFKVTKEQKTEAIPVKYVNENGEEKAETLSIKTAGKARKAALKDKSIRAKYRDRSAKMDLVKVKYRETAKAVTQTETYRKAVKAKGKKK